MLVDIWTVNSILTKDQAEMKDLLDKGDFCCKVVIKLDELYFCSSFFVEDKSCKQ